MADEIQTDPTDQADQAAQLAAETHVVALANATSQHHLAREFAIAAMGRGEMTELQAADYMLAFSRQVVAAKDAAGGKPVEPAVTGGPRLSSDPAEAAAGMLAPAPRDPHAVADRLAEYLDIDTSTWTPEAHALARGFSVAFPAPRDSASRECFDAGINLIRDTRGTDGTNGMEAEAAKYRYSEAHCDEQLETKWGHEFEMNWRFVDAALRQLQPRELAYLKGQHLLTYPPFLDKLATLGEKFLNTDDGLRWTKAQAKQNAVAEERERAEAAEQERKAEERFGFGRGR